MPSSTGRPNILLIHSDQHRFDCLGANGHRQLQTPHLDQLAAQGVNFTHAFTPTAICSPARASMLTGVWPSQHGCCSIPGTELYRPADASLVTYSQLLSDAGYWLGYVGRYHDELVGEPTNHGFSAYVPGRLYSQWRRQQGVPRVGRSGGYLGYFGAVDPHIIPEQSELAWGADHVIRLLEGRANKDQPFLVRWDPVEPHLPCTPPEPYASMYDPAQIEPWPSFGDTLEGKPYIQSQQLRTWRVEGWTWPQWAPTVSFYFGVISLLDAQIGRVLAALDQLGLANDTLVIYSADHGDLCGGHGMMDKHFVMYDDVQRVPLIARYPGVLSQGQTCDAFVVNEIDMAATFCGVAGIRRPDHFEGRSLIDIANSQDPAPRQDVFGQWHGAQLGLYTQRMVRDRRWKYMWNCTAEDELYDLEHDPAELKNLATDAHYDAPLRRLRRRLIAWMESIQDPMLHQWSRDVLDP